MLLVKTWARLFAYSSFPLTSEDKRSRRHHFYHPFPSLMSSSSITLIIILLLARGRTLKPGSVIINGEIKIRGDCLGDNCNSLSPPLSIGYFSKLFTSLSGARVSYHGRNYDSLIITFIVLVVVATKTVPILWGIYYSFACHYYRHVV